MDGSSRGNTCWTDIHQWISSGGPGSEHSHINYYTEPCLEEQGWENKNQSSQSSGLYFLQLTYFIDSKRWRHHDLILWFIWFGLYKHTTSNVCWHMNHILLRKYMFKAFYLHLSNILMCLQPCGSDMIRRSGAESNAMIWGKWGRQREQVRARKSLFLFIVKISFPTAQSLPKGPNHLVLHQTASQTGCHCSTLSRLPSIYERRIEQS